MAIKAGNIIHRGNDTVVIDRLQTVGPGQVNIPVETIYEVGNYQSVGQVRDTPDLTFTLESLDVSEEIEALLLGKKAGDYVATDVLDPAKNKPLDVVSEFKQGANADSPYEVDYSVATPYLALESLSYKFGLKDNASQTATLRGDSIFYNPGSAYVEVTTATGAAGQQVSTANPAYSVTEGGVTRRILSVMAGTRRLIFGTDYIESYGAVSGGAAVTTMTITGGYTPKNGDNIQIVYSSPTPLTQDASVHEGVGVKPAAIRGRDIWVYIGGYDAANKYNNKVLGVQAVTWDWKVTLDKDEEFGNYHVVAQDFDVPVVSGTVQVKPLDAAALVALVQKITGTGATGVAAGSTSVPFPIDVVLTDPDTGDVLKRLHCPDARFSVPGFSTKVQQKLDVTINWTSDTGLMQVTGQ